MFSPHPVFVSPPLHPSRQKTKEKTKSKSVFPPYNKNNQPTKHMMTRELDTHSPASTQKSSSSHTDRPHDKAANKPKKTAKPRKPTKGSQPPNAGDQISDDPLETYEDGIVQATRSRRAAIWEQLQQLCTEGPSPTIWRRVLDHQLKYASTHGRSPGSPQKCSSTKTLLEMTAGVLMKYAPELGKPPAFYKAKCDRLKMLAFRDPVNRAPPATWSVILRILLDLEKQNKQRQALWLFLCWRCASRGTSITKLQIRNVFLLHSTQGSNLALTFVEGKTLATSGPYTLHLAVPPQIVALIRTTIGHKSRYKSSRLFTAADQSYIAKTLKDNGLEIRSLRRGALQAMAKAGAPPAELLHFSRHSETKGLSAYLDHGLHSHWEEASQLKWGAYLTM